MNAICRLCKDKLVAQDGAAIMILMLSHILRKHYDDEKYSKVWKELVEIMKGDFIMEDE